MLFKINVLTNMFGGDALGKYVFLLDFVGENMF